jgi:hypothetical protein
VDSVRRFLIILLIVINSGCQSVPNYCGISSTKATSLISNYPDRGPVNGGYDENGDGIVDKLEAFSHWDFSQVNRVLQSGVENQQYKWVNIDTCYQFSITASDFYDDSLMPILYQTCRNFDVSVISPDNSYLGNLDAKACRNFANQKWEIL